MALDDAKFVGMLAAAGTAVNGAALDAVVNVRIVEGAVEIDVLFHGDAEGHAGRREAAFARDGLLRGGGGAAAPGRTTHADGVVLGLLEMGNIWGREPKRVWLVLRERALLGLGRGHVVRGADRGDRRERARG